MDLCLRDLTENDLQSAEELLSLAFGGLSRLDDLRLYRQIQPDGWFAAELEDRLVGMVGAANYGAFAHVGLMAVHPGFRRQGIGLALMQFLLQRLEAQGVPLVTLDSSPMGRPLYDRLGFVPYDETLVFHRSQWNSQVHQSPDIEAISPANLDELVQADTPIFGADRRKVFQTLLEQFPSRALLQRDSNGKIAAYLFTQKYRMGPWVMFQPERGEALLQAALGLGGDGTVTVTVPSVNQAAVDLLVRYGFEHVRSNRHMARGVGGCPGDRMKVYSQMSLAIG
jgi:ribosomal protein S18 acetylase RimI-like enzyme